MHAYCVQFVRHVAMPKASKSKWMNQILCSSFPTTKSSRCFKPIGYHSKSPNSPNNFPTPQKGNQCFQLWNQTVFVWPISLTVPGDYSIVLRKFSRWLCSCTGVDGWRLLPWSHGYAQLVQFVPWSPWSWRFFQLMSGQNPVVSKPPLAIGM